MNHAIQIRLRSCEGAFLRTLGMTERRGFRLLSANLQSQEDDYQQLSLVISSPDRSVEVLKRQLDRLHDVIDVMVVAGDALAYQLTPDTRLAVGV